MTFNPATAVAPVQSASGLGANWFNVLRYGAAGNGTTDDTSAINLAIAALNTATAGVLYFPAGTYKCTAALTALTAHCRIVGDGCGSFGAPGTAAPTTITCTSATAVLFTTNTTFAEFADLLLKNTAGSTPSAGAGISVTGATGGECVSYSRVAVYGFYVNFDVQVGDLWVMDACMSTAPVKYGLKIQNTVVADAGDWCVTNSAFYDSHGADAALYMASSGGGKIVNCKINTLSDYFLRGIDVVGGAGTSILLIANCSIEGIANQCIRAAGTWPYITITNCELALHSVPSTSAIDLTGSTYATITGIAATGGAGSPSATVVSLTTCTNVSLAAIVQNSFTDILSQSGCSGIIDATGGSSAYSLPVASTSTLGGVKVDGTSITIDGTTHQISASGGGVFSGARYTTAAGQSISDSTETILNFATLDYDPDSAVTTGASWHYTAPVTGKYLIRAGIQFVPHTWAGGQVIVLTVYVNGSGAANLQYLLPQTGSSVQPSLGGSDVLALTAGDSVNIRVFQNSGGALALEAAATYNNVAIVLQA